MTKKRFLSSKWPKNKLISKNLMKRRSGGKLYFPFVKSLTKLHNNNLNKCVVQVKKHFKYKVKPMSTPLTEAESKLIASYLLPRVSDSCEQVIEKKSKEKKEGLSYFPIEEENIHGILFFKKNQKISFNGYARINVLHGEVEINGFSAKGMSSTYDIYSSPTSALQYIRDNTSLPCLDVEKKSLIVHLSKIFKKMDESEEFIKNESFYSVILVERLNLVMPRVMFPDALRSPLFSSLETDSVLETDSWSVVVDEILSNNYNNGCSVMFCGGKDVGKSSMARYTINRMLSRYDSVFYLECDSGQTEFTPPGILSLVKVTSPLLGPPSTHLIKPERSFFYGYISPKDSPTQYIHLIEQLLVHYYNHYATHGPLIINQQGWVKGLGLALLIDCIRIASPKYIIQIDSVEYASRNLLVKLNSDFIGQQRGWCIDPNYKSSASNCNHGDECKFIHLNSLTNKRSFSVNKSATTRNETTAAYFCTMYEKDFKCHGQSNLLWSPPLLSKLLPYVVKWKYLALHVMHQNVSFELILHAFNLSVVCLATINKESIILSDDTDLPNKIKENPMAEYSGMGIVRNIDPVNKLFYILTPEPPEVLQHVNALLKGNIQLPVSYLIEHPCESHPYYCHDYISVSSKVSSGMKTRFNLKRKPSRNKNSFGEK
ncbi:polynucleotide 5'-hydroxyl-kinase NOL9 isoform X1 [Hydra vulgaris]|nr:polynucleotide 5'-hydroxyl-kinase NOL9-like [Hydra vulgaris]